MTRPTTPHAELERRGFKFVGESSEDSDRIGATTTKHYTKTRNSVGKGGIVKPITHHILVNEYSKNPGNHDVSYFLEQGGKPYAEGRYDFISRHKSNAHRGSDDPILDTIRHHNAIDFTLDKERSVPPLEEVTPENVHRLAPGSHHVTPGWDESSDYDMKSPRRIRRGPEYPMVHLNSVQDSPLDPHVYRRLTGGRHGRPVFEYHGRFPEDSGVDVYHVSHEDPEDPYMRYGFTVRHNPGATSTSVKDHRGRRDPLPEKPLIFSYNMTHYPIDMGEDHVGDFRDVTGEPSPVANFTEIGPLIERHHNMLRSVGLMALPPKDPRPDWHFTAGVSKQADEFDDIISGAGSAGPCWSCGKATYNYPEGKSIQRDSSVPVSAHEETGGDMHGPDINLCGDCAGDSDNYHMAVTHGSRGPGRIWHYNDQSVPGCPGCGSHLMDQADEDLRP